MPVLLAPGTIAAVARQHHLAEAARPYWIPSQAPLFYLAAPIVVLSAVILLLSPGLFLTLALDAARDVHRWLLKAFALSLLVVGLVTAVVQALAGEPLRGGGFLVVVVACALGGFGLLLLRIARGSPVSWPLARPGAGTALVGMAVIPSLLLVALTPKFYWEGFNGDGVHAFETSRLLLFHAFPFWPASAGEVQPFPGMTSMLFAYPASWFLRLFGEHEAAARLPLVLYLVPLYAGIVALSETGRRKRLGPPERSLVWLGLLVFVVTLAFSATYNPYAADIALPATQDSLAMVCFLGFVLGYVRREAGWMSLFLVFTYLSLPVGLLLIVLWSCAALLLLRPRPTRTTWLAAIALAGCLLASSALVHLLALLDLPLPGREYGPVNLLLRFLLLQFTDWGRLAFLVVPAGILPALSLVAWRWQDRVARAVTLVTAAYFLCFFVQAHIALHHFVPAMLLPLVVFWRLDFASMGLHRRALWAAVGAAGVVALLLSLPTVGSPDTSGRRVGVTIRDRLGGYEEMDPAAFERSELLAELFAYGWDPTVPDPNYGGSPLVWFYYSQRATASDPVNYVLQAATDPAPALAMRVAERDAAALYVLDPEIWHRHRSLRPPTPAGSPVYHVPRGILFRSVPLEDGPYIFDVPEVLGRLGIPVEAIAERLGVERGR